MQKDIFYKKVIKELDGVFTSVFLANYATEPRKIVNYLSNYTPKTLSLLYKEYMLLTPVKKELFFNALLYNSKQNISKKSKLFSINSLERQMWRVKSGMLNKRGIFFTGDNFCERTITGFNHAFQEGYVLETKANIDGKKKRVFVKGAFGQRDVDATNIGINFLILDPEKLTIYNLYMETNFKRFKKMNVKDIIKYPLKSKNAIKLVDLQARKLNKPKEISKLKTNILKYYEAHKKNTATARNLHALNLKKSEFAKKSKISKPKPLKRKPI